jgi:hypothetical protein
MLHGSGIQRLADASQKSLTLDFVVTCDPDFDQLVSSEADVDLLHDGIGEALIPDQNDGGEAVCAGFEGLALKRGESNHLRGSVKAEF